MTLILSSKTTLKVSRGYHLLVLSYYYKKKRVIVDTKILEVKPCFPIILPRLQCFPQDVFNPRLKTGVNGLSKGIVFSCFLAKVGRRWRGTRTGNAKESCTSPISRTAYKQRHGNVSFVLPFLFRSFTRVCCAFSSL